MASDRALYSKYNAYVYGGFAVCFVAGAVAFLVAAARNHDVDSIPQIIVAVIALLIATIFVRIARLRVVLTENYVALVNPLRTHYIAWDDVERIDTFVLAGWKVRVWSQGAARVAFGLSQYSRYRFGSDPQYDAFDRDAPAWMRRGFTELQDFWRTHTSV